MHLLSVCLALNMHKLSKHHTQATNLSAVMLMVYYAAILGSHLTYRSAISQYEVRDIIDVIV
jgi:L-asparagine transporter-like permease